jgi:16S rRNA (adenine1518-N6/adenine1519-N6)-dimethyltransferase
MTLRPAEFYPQPRVDSRLIRITLKQGNVADCRFTTLQRVVRCSFANRRKTLLNNLLSMPGLLPESKTRLESSKSFVRAVIESAGLLPTDRAEKLTTAQFLRLAQKVELAISSA